jgi:predicted metal-dependent peptidase
MSLPSRLQRARLTLLLDFPFYGMLAMRLAFEIDPSVTTAETDGRVIRFNPGFCDPLNDRQLVWLLAHEVSHPAFGHIWRQGNRDHDKFNAAADYTVNEMLDEVIASKPGAKARMERIPGVLLDSQYFGMSVEEIYSLLPDSPAGGGGPGGTSAVGTFSKPKASPSASSPDSQPSAEESQLQQEWQAAAQEAATVSRMRAKGDLPGRVSELLRELVEPAVPWQDLLRQFATRVARDDYSFARANRRYAHLGFSLPTLRSVSMGPLVVAADTSGSIRCNQKLLTTFLSELQGILDEVRPERIHMLDCDARIQARHEFEPGDDLRGTTFHGGGGTCFRPVFHDVAARDLQPAALIYFTDLEGSFPAEAPDFPVLWLNYGNPRSKAPFGDTITVLPA